MEEPSAAQSDLLPAAVEPRVTPLSSLGLRMVRLENPAEQSRAEGVDTDLSPDPDSSSDWKGSEGKSLSLSESQLPRL